jgi:trans-AT polyketide synthase, acyltransferase and oxidoreductase domains
MISALPSIGGWQPASEAPIFAPDGLAGSARRFRQTAFVVQDPSTGAVGVGLGGTAVTSAPSAWPLLSSLSPLYPEWLGDRSFAAVHGLRFPYVAGAMANGIATARMVAEMAGAGFLAFFGAAGLAHDRVVVGLDEIARLLPDRNLPWGSNLIHSPQEPDLERRVADLYVQRGVKCVSASAYMKLTAAIVRYSAAGLRQLPDGSIHREHFVFAKVSRPEVARHFMEPAPRRILDALVADGSLTADEARLAAHVPVAEDYIVESDSGGHTDNRPLTALFPVIQGLRDEIMAARRYGRPIRLGAAGGLGTPEAVAAAFGLGAAFVLTGSVNQACVESGLSESGRHMLANADLADVIMAPAADMFELGVEVQVLRRGTMFAQRGHRLYQLYRSVPSLEAIPAADRARLEKDVFRQSLDDAWAGTRDFWMGRDPREVTKAEADPRHKMALVFRSYLGRSSRWAIDGAPERSADFQIWCGPAMGAFNRWAKGSFLENPDQRTVVQVARNLMEGAAVVTRAGQLRASGAPVPSSAFSFRPRPLA